MKIRIGRLAIFGAIICVGLQSCVVGSLHPFYDEANRYHIDSLDGKWISKDGKTKVEITTITDTTGLASQKNNFEGIKSIKHKVGSKLKVKFKLNDSIAKGSSYKDELRMLKGSDEDKKKVLSKAKYDKKQVMYYLYPYARKHYKIKYTAEGVTSVFKGVLSKFNKNYFLDVTLDDDFIDKQIANPYIEALTFKIHVCYKLQLVDDELQIYSIDMDDFKNLIRSKKIRIPYSRIDDQVIITAETDDLQKFLLKLSGAGYFEKKAHKDILKRE